MSQKPSLPQSPQSVQLVLTGNTRQAIANLKQQASKTARWSADNLGLLKVADPATPDELDDRAADNWRPLLAIADAAGGGWPKRAREAAIALSGGAARPADSYGTMLLSDLRDFFDAERTETKKTDPELTSAKICEKLAHLETRPWPEYGRGGRPITQRQLAALLKPFVIVPQSVGAEGLKGYKQSSVADAFMRYLRDRSADPPNPHGEKGLDSFFDPPSGDGLADRKTQDPLTQRTTSADRRIEDPGEREPDDGVEL